MIYKIKVIKSNTLFTCLLNMNVGSFTESSIRTNFNCLSFRLVRRMNGNL